MRPSELHQEHAQLLTRKAREDESTHLDRRAARELIRQLREWVEAQLAQ